MSFEDVAKSTGLSAEQVASIPEDLRNDKSLEPIKDLTGLMTSYRDGQKMIGGSVRIPREDSKPEEVEAFYNKLGRPESPDKYDLKLPYPEYVNWDENGIKEFRTMAHKAGYTPKQIQAAVDFEGERVAKAFQAQEAIFEGALTELKKEWGGGFDKNLALIRRARDLYGGDGAKEYFKDDPSGNDVVLLKMIARMAADLEEGDFLGGPGESGGLNAEEAKAKIAEIMKDPNDLYHAKFANKAGHIERIQEVQALYDIAYRAI